MAQEFDSILIELEVTAVYDEENPWMQGALLININTEKPYAESDIVMTEDLLESLKKDGEYFLFSCVCGVPECSGWNRGIEVVNATDSVRWTNLNTNESWIFERKRILDQVADIKKEAIFFKAYFKEKGIDYVGVGYAW